MHCIGKVDCLSEIQPLRLPLLKYEIFCTYPSYNGQGLLEFNSAIVNLL